MAEGKKRAAVKVRKMQAHQSKGARRRQRSTTTSRSETRAYGNRTITRTSGQGLSITVQIPPLRRPKQTVKKSDAPLSLRRRILRPVLILPLLLAAGSFVIFTPASGTEKAPATAVSAAERTEPDYRPLVPSAEKASATRYDAKRNLVSYTTTFSGVRITVSQQAVPANFKKDSESMVKAADSIGAKQRIETARGALYIATNEEVGNQLAVFTEQNVLLFIHTDRKLDDMSWKSFIELLQAKAWDELI